MKLNEVSNLSLIWGWPRQLDELKGRFLLVPEMRPWLLGLKLCEQFKRRNYPHVYVTDNMLGLLFLKRKIKETLLFYLKKEANVLECPSGSLYVWHLSRYHQVPISFLPGQNDWPQGQDKDASTIGGIKLVTDNKAVIRPQIEKIKI